MQRISNSISYERFKILSYIVVSLPFIVAILLNVLGAASSNPANGAPGSAVDSIQNQWFEFLLFVAQPALLVINGLFPPEGLTFILNVFVAILCTFLFLPLLFLLVAIVAYKRFFWQIILLPILLIILTTVIGQALAG